MDENLKAYLLELLTEMGQMDHISGKVKCAECGFHKGNIYNQSGVMKMSANRRCELVARGWQLLEDEK